MTKADSPKLPFSSIRNSELFANHWLERRLPDEPEWGESRERATACLDALAKLWTDKKDLLTPDLGEHTMEDEWVHPVLAAFGWEYVYQTQIQGRRPDYGLFLTKDDKRAAIKAGKTEPDFWKTVQIVADAKAWDRRLDRPTRTRDQREFPPEQIEDYLRLTGLDWGLLTNGRVWRFSPRELRRSQPRFETFLEIDLVRAIERWSTAGGRSRHTKDDALAEFMPWFLLTTPNAFIPAEGRDPIITRALQGSTEYRVAVGGALRERVFEALRLCIEGFLSHKPNGLDPVKDMAECRASAFTLLFRLLFVLFAEDRQLLPYRKNDLYTRNRALSRQHSELMQHLGTLSAKQTTIWQEWGSLFALIDEGKATYGVPAYNGGLFDRDSHPFLTKHSLPDTYAAQVLDHLRRAPENFADPESDLVRVDYRDLAIQHLGNIYEGLLELRPRHAAEPMIVVAARDSGKTIEKTIPAAAATPDGFEATERTYNAGDVYLETDKGERRASGSYYTPDHIVAYIVENTLGPICAEMDAQLRGEIEKATAAHKDARGANREAMEKDVARLRADFDDRVLRLTVLDPAMGSGHFLLRACQYLAEQIATNPFADDPEAPDTQQGEGSTLLFWKRKVIERCIFGVDKNPIAVELAKLALWLETVAIDQPLSFLDHHLRHGDSLVGAKLDMLGRLYDPRVGPAALPAQTVEARLPVLLKPLSDIRDLPSKTVAQVKAKEQLYRKAFDTVRQPFRHVADLWVSTFFVPNGQTPLTPAQFQEALSVIDKPTKFAALETRDWFRKAIAVAETPGVDAFHWELEFPEVFLAPDRSQHGKAGFDAIVGNPPYDVLAERELGHDLTALKQFVEAMPLYDPSRRGKNNLYKLFICRALDLLADGGRFGFIVPMAVLGDDQSADIRKAMFGAGALTAVETFPQKDDADRRVFSEAKLSTAIFVMRKTKDPTATAESFRARQHAADQIECASPSLTLRTADIPLYDPQNLSLLSCTQGDWNLAVRIMGSGRMARLGAVCKFFQGEVNETNQRKAGNLLDQGGLLVTRGASVCLYAIREASQGEDIRLDVGRFTANAATNSKAFHYRHRRVVLQEASPQNNFRRIIAAPLAAGEFCNHTINYATESSCQMDLHLLLALLNSRLVEWYFRLGSTNAHVSQYQLGNLPCPMFGPDSSPQHTNARDVSLAAIKAGRLADAFDALKPALASPPFSTAVQDVLVDLVKRIIRAEKARGEIARPDRSKLADDARPLQALIDRIIYTMAGLTDAEARALEDRLSRML